MGKKRKAEQLEDFPKAAIAVQHKLNIEKRFIVILERANLESVKIGNSFELLNCDDHTSFIKKFNKDIGSCRPDILHQCLLMLQDSPLNQAGRLQVYIHTEKNVLIEIHPQCRIPRTFKRFAGLMDSGDVRLLKIIRNPVTDYLPVGCKKIGTSFSSSKLINPRDLVPSEEPLVVVIGAMAHGKVEVPYIEEEVAISQYHLSAALTCSKLCSAFEEVLRLMDIWIIIILIVTSMLWGITNPLMKYNSKGIEKVAGSNIFKQVINEITFLLKCPKYMLAFVLNQMGSLLFIVALGNMDISLVVPFTNSLTFVITAISGQFFGEDKPNFLSWIGIALICTGITLCVASKS